MAHMDTALCHNCKRHFGYERQIIQGADGTWVHNTMLYDLKCNPFEQYIAVPLEEE